MKGQSGGRDNKVISVRLVTHLLFKSCGVCVCVWNCRGCVWYFYYLMCNYWISSQALKNNFLLMSLISRKESVWGQPTTKAVLMTREKCRIERFRSGRGRLISVQTNLHCCSHLNRSNETAKCSWDSRLFWCLYNLLFLKICVINLVCFSVCFVFQALYCIHKGSLYLTLPKNM